jgi:hypothetical protein
MKTIWCSRRGQIFSGEFILGFVLFTLALGIMLMLWNNSMKDVLGSYSVQDMEDAGVDAAETLVRTQGVPSDWNESNVVSLGLANDSRILRTQKVKMFVHYMSMDDSDLCPGTKNYDCNLHMLGLGGYDFLFNLSYINGSTVVIDGKKTLAGRAPVNETDRVTVVRSVIINDEITKLYLTVWR